MTGRELKAFAATVHDDARIEFKEKDYRSWYEVGAMRATLQIEWHEEQYLRKEC